MAREEEEKLAGGCFCRDAVEAAMERLRDARTGREKRWNLEENSLAIDREGIEMFISGEKRVFCRWRLTNCEAQARVRDCKSQTTGRRCG